MKSRRYREAKWLLLEWLLLMSCAASSLPADPVTLWVYAGADGEFEIYEDDGVSFGYEEGASATIPLRWDDAERRLVIGERTGAFPGMLAERTFKVVFVSAGEMHGHTPEPGMARTVRYLGREVAVAR
jgi:alpha-D-xyloside xylohydrolase